MVGTAIDRDAVLPEIYAAVASGASLDRTLREVEGMPSSSTFWRWHMEDKTIRENLARARLNGVEAHMDEALAIADDGSNDYITKTNGDGRTYEALNSEHVQRSKLRVETRLKLAAMMAPRKYGPKLDLKAEIDGQLQIILNKP